MHAVKIKDLYFKYDENDSDIISGLSLDIYCGEILTVLGLSGCGKSTLCYCISGIIPHIYRGCLKGEVLVFDEAIAEKKLPSISKSVGIIFQDSDTQLFSPTVEDEIAFGPENLCLERIEIGRRIDESLKITGMEKYRYAHPQYLSGGEKQLVAIASVLALKPEIIIFDESTSYLDSASKERIKETMQKLKERGKTIINVEHDVFNLDISDRVFFMNKGSLEEINRDFKGDILELYKS